MKKLLLISSFVLYTSVLFAQGITNNNQKNIGTLKSTATNGMLPANDIVKNISQSKDLSILSGLLQTASLAESLQSKGPFTVFAPVDSGFNHLAVGKLDSLHKPTHVWELTRMLTYHVVAGNLKARDIEKQINAGKGQAIFTTLSGDKLIAKIDNNRNIVLVDGNGGESIISSFDLQQSNGIVHIITKVLVPKPKAI